MLIEITPQSHPVLLDLRYATLNNFTGHSIYQKSRCFLHPEAMKPFENAVNLAEKQGMQLKIFDAFRPQAAQQVLWNYTPDADYVTPPKKGSPHTRGVAIDLTLVDANGVELDCGTTFDDFTKSSHHGALDISKEAATNRYQLLGIMISAGWDLYNNEWWHYQLFNARSYPLIQEDVGGMMAE